MAKKILKSNTEKSGKTFGYNRLNDGQYTIVKCARYQSEPTDFAPEGYEVLAIFVDSVDDQCLQLNGCWAPKMALNEDGKRFPVKPHGTLYDALFEKIGHLDFADFCEAFNKSDLIGRKFDLKWEAYVKADDDSRYGHVPFANLVENP